MKRCGGDYLVAPARFQFSIFTFQFPQCPFGGEEDDEENEDEGEVEELGVAGVGVDDGLEVVALGEELGQLVELVGVEHLCAGGLGYGVEQGVVGDMVGLLEVDALDDEVARGGVAFACQGSAGGVGVVARLEGAEGQGVAAGGAVEGELRIESFLIIRAEFEADIGGVDGFVVVVVQFCLDDYVFTHAVDMARGDMQAFLVGL